MMRVLLTLVLVFFCACSKFSREIVKAQYPSPDGQLMATWVVSDAGATTRVGNRVVIHRKDQGFDDEAAAVFVAYDNHALAIEWDHSPRGINIACKDCIRDEILKMTVMDGDIDIHYSLPSLDSPSNESSPASPGR